MKEEKHYIYGRHALVEALRNTPKAVKSVFLAPQVNDEELIKLIRENGIQIESLAKAGLPQTEKEATHQGVVALVVIDRIIRDYKEFIENLTVTTDTCIVIMGELQDPQNVGAVIRSAAALGVAAVLIPEYNQAPINGTVVKVSAGMAFRVPLVSVGNINNAVRDLKERGFWIYGLEGESEKSITDEAFDTPTVFIIGNESKGIREKTRDLCDILVSIPMHPRCESMNAAASTAIALYEWSRKHPESLI